jgi:hypothetical protein
VFFVWQKGFENISPAKDVWEGDGDLRMKGF